jgi:2-iminobutanoate/2-iminopropanoate deaminase
VKTTVFLTRVEHFAAMNRVYATFFPNDPPARSTIRAELMLDALVEIEAIAVAGGS